MLLHFLRRIVFDMERLDRVKVSDRFEFPLVLDMAPFLENGELDVLRGTAAGSVGSQDDVTPAVCKDVWRRNIWLSDLKTEESRSIAASVSASLNSRTDLDNVSWLAAFCPRFPVVDANTWCAVCVGVRSFCSGVALW
jgi:hypothetical protein